MSIINGQSVNALVSNNAWISKNSYADDGDYVSAQSTYQVVFPDTSKAHIYYNTTLKLFRFHDGTSWNSISKSALISEGGSFPSSPQIGDVFIKGGSPGHAVIVVDMAVNPQNNKKLFMVAQSYMPAQDIHILINQNKSTISPWYDLDETASEIETPEWTFAANQLKRF